jgi:hypothetical protein
MAVGASVPVIRLTREGRVLKNMRHGSVEHRKELAEQIAMLEIRSVGDVRADFERRRAVERQRKYLANRRLARKLWISTIRARGIPSTKQ